MHDDYKMGDLLEHQSEGWIGIFIEYRKDDDMYSMSHEKEFIRVFDFDSMAEEYWCTVNATILCPVSIMAITSV